MKTCKSQIYFNSNAPMGITSNVDENYRLHCKKKGGDWGNNSQLTPLFPRGRAYWRMFDIQFEAHAWNS